MTPTAPNLEFRNVPQGTRTCLCSFSSHFSPAINLFCSRPKPVITWVLYFVESSVRKSDAVKFLLHLAPSNLRRNFWLNSTCVKILVFYFYSSRECLRSSPRTKVVVILHSCNTIDLSASFVLLTSPQLLLGLRVLQMLMRRWCAIRYSVLLSSNEV